MKALGDLAKAVILQEIIGTQKAITASACAPAIVEIVRA